MTATQRLKNRLRTIRSMVEKSIDLIETGTLRTRPSGVPEILDALNTFVLQTTYEYSAKQAAEEAVDFYTKSNNLNTPTTTVK